MIFIYLVTFALGFWLGHFIGVHREHRRAMDRLDALKNLWRPEP